jgi:zinc and cadmium transporter
MVLYSFIASILVSLVSLVGVVLLSFGTKRVEKYLSLLVAFSAGTLLGDAFLHMIGESLEGMGYDSTAALSILGGFIFSFIIERFVHWHHCHTGQEHKHRLATMNLVGDSIHNLLDGFAIAVSFAVSLPVGIATTLAIILHEIPQEMGDFAVLLYSGFSKKKAIVFNLATAFTAVVGVGIGLVAISAFESIEKPLLLFAAGNFIYIAATDIMPELNRHEGIRRGIAHLIAILAGVGIMYLLLRLG